MIIPYHIPVEFQYLPLEIRMFKKVECGVEYFRSQPDPSFSASQVLETTTRLDRLEAMVFGFTDVGSAVIAALAVVDTNNSVKPNVTLHTRIQFALGVL